MPPTIRFNPYIASARNGREENGGKTRDDASPPPHISYTLLHFLNMTRRAATSTTPTTTCPHPMIESVALLRESDELRRFAGQAPFYMQNFTGRGSEIASRQANEVHRGK